MAWADDAACAGMDPDLFHPSRGEVLDERAIAACRTCTVQPECLDWALRHEHHGYWGGQSELGRKRLRRTLGIRIEEAHDDDTPIEEIA